MSRVDCAQSSTSTVQTNGIRLLLQLQLDRLPAAHRNQHRGPAAVRQFQIHRHAREIRVARVVEKVDEKVVLINNLKQSEELRKEYVDSEKAYLDYKEDESIKNNMASEKKLGIVKEEKVPELAQKRFEKALKDGKIYSRENPDIDVTKQINDQIAEKEKLDPMSAEAEAEFQKKYGAEVKKITEEINAKETKENAEKMYKEKYENNSAEILKEKVKAAEGPKTMDQILGETKHNMATNPDATMKTSGIFSEDASKFNLKNIAELEAKMGVEEEAWNKAQIDSTSTTDAVKGGMFGGFFSSKKPEEKLVSKEYNVESPLFKDGALKGNHGRLDPNDATGSVDKMTQFGEVKATLGRAKEAVLKEMYTPASEGSNIHFEKGVFEKLNEMKLTEGASIKNAGEAGKGASSGAGLYLKSLGLDDKTKIEWSSTEEGGLEGLYKRTTEKGVEESHKLKVNFGKDGAISGFEAQKLDGDKWINNDAKIDLGNGQQVGIERAKEIAKMNEKQVRMDMIKQNMQAVKDGVEGAKSMGLMEKLKLKLGKGAKAEEAKTMLENAKAAVKSHTEATDVMAKNIGGILGDAGRVDLKAISAAASGAVEGAAKEAGKNIHAMGNNTGKGITNLLFLAGVGMAFGAVKATFDNSAEQRRQKQLELMAMRQQYGGAM